MFSLILEPRLYRQTHFLYATQKEKGDRRKRGTSGSEEVGER